MDPAKKARLRTAVDHPAVGMIEALFPAFDAAALLPAQGKCDLVFFHQLVKFCDQPVISPYGKQQIGIVAAEQGPEFDQQPPFFLEGEAVVFSLQMDFKFDRFSVIRITVGSQNHHQQGNRGGINCPGRVEGFQCLYLPLISGQHPAARQGESTGLGCITKRKRDVGIVIR